MKIKINLIIQSLITTIIMEVLKRLDSNTFLKSLVNSSTNAITYSTRPFHHGRKKIIWIMVRRLMYSISCVNLFLLLNVKRVSGKVKILVI